MSIFKCISCGETAESSIAYSCPKCGCKMYKTPYERAETLVSEIQGFIKHLEKNEICIESLSYYRGEDDKITKDDDDERFPTFEKIKNYVSFSEKTEIFQKRLKNTISQLRNHIHDAYSETYDVDFSNIFEKIKTKENTIKKVAELCDVEFPSDGFSDLEMKMFYSEFPNNDLIQIADNILEKLDELAEKIFKFIKQNNMYGVSFAIDKDVCEDLTEDSSKELLEECLESVVKTIDKKYYIDILSDGTDELEEMLAILWDAIYLIMSLPVISKKYSFTFKDNSTVTDNEFYDYWNHFIEKHYFYLNNLIDSQSFLSDKSEDELFSIYENLLNLDTFGYFGMNTDSLLKVGESEKKLVSLIGLSSIKETIKKIKAYAVSNQNSNSLNIHMAFYGNPGTGKTEVARIIAGILHENGILPTDNLVEVDRSGLVSPYYGATAEKTKDVIRRAMGGVLFIDEAYSLFEETNVAHSDYGREAINILVKAMEDHRGEFCVIFAGYKNELKNMMLSNPGMKSRVKFELDFPNYSREELKMIANLMFSKQGNKISEEALDRILDITDIKRKETNFANARELRNIIDQVVMCQSIRCLGTENNVVDIVDVNRYIQDSDILLPVSGNGSNKKILTGDEELEQLVGLKAVKRMILKIKAYAKKNKGQNDFNLHMCFYGNPGTGKTEVARILSRILYDAGVLSESKLIETDAHGLLGKYVGETAPKTLVKINEAMNGVLFVDEAYGLIDSTIANGISLGYGDEAISVLLKEMEDRRGHFCAILAGYKDQMKELIDVNPGFKSRIQFTLDFPDYSRDELKEIAILMLNKRNYIIDNQAIELLLDVVDYYRNKPNFANARTLRNVIDQVIMNQNLRTEDQNDNNAIILNDVNDYISDENIDLSSESSSTKIGF